MLKAVVYDFDGTLTPNPMPIFKILEMSGLGKDAINSQRFLEMTGKIAKQENVNKYEAMIRTILKFVQDAGFALTDNNISIGAEERVYNPGVKELLEWLKQHGIKNYLLSSGAKAYLERLEIAPYFEAVYASTLSYDDTNVVNGIKHVMTDTEKPITLQKIAQDINDSPDDFSGIVYIGDGPTDVVVMDCIKEHGGIAILIQHDTTDPNWPQVDANGVDLATGPDFTLNGELATYLKSLVEP